MIAPEMLQHMWHRQKIPVCLKQGQVLDSMGMNKWTEVTAKLAVAAGFHLSVHGRMWWCPLMAGGCGNWSVH